MSFVLTLHLWVTCGEGLMYSGLTLHLSVTCVAGLMYSSLMLLSTVVFLLVATHLNGWRLTKKYGLLLLVVYVLYTVLASLYELNIFGYFHPSECPSDYWHCSSSKTERFHFSMFKKKEVETQSKRVAEVFSYIPCRLRTYWWTFLLLSHEHFVNWNILLIVWWFFSVPAYDSILRLHWHPEILAKDWHAVVSVFTCLRVYSLSTCCE